MLVQVCPKNPWCVTSTVPESSQPQVADEADPQVMSCWDGLSWDACLSTPGLVDVHHPTEFCPFHMLKVGCHFNFLGISMIWTLFACHGWVRSITCAACASMFPYMHGPIWMPCNLESLTLKCSSAKKGWKKKDWSLYQTNRCTIWVKFLYVSCQVRVVMIDLGESLKNLQALLRVGIGPQMPPWCETSAWHAVLFSALVQPTVDWHPGHHVIWTSLPPLFLQQKKTFELYHLSKSSRVLANIY